MYGKDNFSEIRDAEEDHRKLEAGITIINTRDAFDTYKKK